MIPLPLIAAYTANLVLLVCAWRLPRVRLYVASFLAADLIRLCLLRIQSQAMALYAIDGMLVMSGPLLLTHCLRLRYQPVAGLGATAIAIALIKVYTGHQEATEGIYVAAILASHVYTSIAPIISRSWRIDFDLSDGILLGMSATGLTGAFVVITWKTWDLVNVGNIVAHTLLALLALFSRRRKQSV